MRNTCIAEPREAQGRVVGKMLGMGWVEIKWIVR